MSAPLPPSIMVALDSSTCSLIGETIAAHLTRSGKTFNAPPGIHEAASSPWLTTKEAAAYLRVGVSELHRLAAAGSVPHEQDGGPGGRLHFHRDDLDVWRRAGGRSAV